MPLKPDADAQPVVNFRVRIFPARIAFKLPFKFPAGNCPHHKHVQPLARTIPRWRARPLLHFALRRRSRPERHIAMA
jgi:hypothetical protein